MIDRQAFERACISVFILLWSKFKQMTNMVAGGRAKLNKYLL